MEKIDTKICLKKKQKLKEYEKQRYPKERV